MEGTPLVDALHEYGVEFPCGGKGSCGRCQVKVLEGHIPVNEFHQSRLDELGLESNWRLACLSACQSDLALEVGQFESLIQADESTFEFTPANGLGIAFDLGTTTLVGQLLDLGSGKILAVESGLNPQRKFGSDLVSRLEAGLSGKSEELTSLIRQEVGTMVSRLMEGQGSRLEHMVLVGNTVMHHLFSGLNIRPLSFYPFHSEHMGPVTFSNQDLKWSQVSCQEITFYPNLGSFVGSDVLAGILATGMHRSDSCSVLVDLGTNGEIAVGNKNGLLCASTAAGPAFEGARISQGMQARAGAIASVVSLGSRWQCEVIGKLPSRGICGSGLIDAVAVLRQQDQIGEFGEILSGESSIQLDEHVALTQKDIQEFQLAKAAIAAGIHLLLKQLEFSPHEVEKVYLAGAFGNYVDRGHVSRIGMLDFPEEKIRKLGNSALLGAKMFLFENARDPQEILRVTRPVNLESLAGFQDAFVDRLSFKPIRIS